MAHTLYAAWPPAHRQADTSTGGIGRLRQRQLGHASDELTVDSYGKSLSMGNHVAVDRLEEDIATVESSSNEVAQRGDDRRE